MDGCRFWILGLTTAVLFGGVADQVAHAQVVTWGGRGFSGGYAPGYGVNLRYGAVPYGPYRGYGYAGYPPRYGYGGYYNSNYGSPYYTIPVYVQPTLQGTLTEPAAPAAPATFDGGEIILFSAADTPGEVQYTLNGAPFQLKPGQVQRFTNDRAWTIEVAPSNGQPPQRFTLSSGRYKFKPTVNGISLVSTQDMPGNAPQTNVQPPPPVPNPN